MRDSKCDLVKRRASVAQGELECASSVDVKASSMLSSCRICLSSIFDPAALTCGHRFCERCLDQYWRVREKPDFIVCPLCRACAFNIDFAKEEMEEGASTEDFRKVFTEMQNIGGTDFTSTIVVCLKISVIMPALYCLVKWLKIPFAELITNIHSKFTRKM
ncbi:unnamed protein product [Chrysodeixis includens]|uniref:RING-type domain-containing protein n=1 Tax=Chrysodeixis includens TaxID=689277 RepID=A0A9N8L407_CHRIL|nr:unnamed protein product [Chrysodeixis includens]